MIYPEFHQQITYEALRVCHAVRKEPDILTRQRMIAEIFTSGMYKRLITNAQREGRLPCVTVVFPLMAMARQNAVAPSHYA